MQRSQILRALAMSLLAGEATVEQITSRANRLLGKRWRWIRPLATRYVTSIAERTPPHHRNVIRFLAGDSGFQRAWAKYRSEIRVEHWVTEPQGMRPVPAARDWNVPPLESVAALSSWLNLVSSDLLWFADLKDLARRSRSPKLSHYHYRVQTKSDGGIRLIEAPKKRLKGLQRHILSGILDLIPPHPVVHGFVKGRSIKTFVAPHVGQTVILRMDLQDFFPSFPAARIQALFRTMGYPEAVADLLAGICTNSTPRCLWNKPATFAELCHVNDARNIYCRPHLPQGAPTSPALANLCSYRLDSRLAGLARSVGAHYTRYADDLAFSGGKALEQNVERFSIHVAAILLEEGFSVNHRKTRIMRQGVRQYLAGIVANSHPNPIRADFDRLKAMLTNCVRHGPGSQNREAHPNFYSHLRGKIAFIEMINPVRAKRLRALFDQVRWE